MYYQLNIDYIIETYCVNKDKPQLQCNGKCHLAKQLQITDANTSEEQSSFNLVYQAFYPLYFQVNTLEQIQQVCLIDHLNDWCYQSNLKHTYHYNCFHPPQQIS